MTPREGPVAVALDCAELQWWFVVPRPGEVSAAAWYDRDTGALTMIRETAQPVVATDSGDGSVRIEIDEWKREPNSSESFGYDRITMIAVLTPDRAEFRSVTTGATSTRLGDPDFEGNWTGVGLRRIVANGRYKQVGPNSYRATPAIGIGVGLVDVTVGDLGFHCLRGFDLPIADGSEEIGQPLIDLGTGRTVMYWQYRPTAWDPDADDWIAHHPGADLTIDGISYQRRNCTGRDEVSLTQFALGIA